MEFIFWLFQGDFLYKLIPGEGTTFSLVEVDRIDVRTIIGGGAYTNFTPRGVAVGSSYGYVHFDFSEPSGGFPPAVVFGQRNYRFNVQSPSFF